MQPFLHSHYKKLLIFSLIGILLLQFNNCGNKLSSQQNISELASISSNVSLADVPVNAANPYYVQCLTSSDGARVSSALTMSVKTSGPIVANAKMTSLDWNQDRDLIVTLDNACIADGNYTDPMLAHILPRNIQTDRPFTVYTIKKDEVKNLKLFIENALASNCLISAEKNEELKIKSDTTDPYLTTQRHLSAAGISESFLTTLMAYGSASPVKVAVIDTGVDTSNPDLSANIARTPAGQVIGYNSTSDSTDYLTDSGYHGTHVAGLIGAGFRNGISGTGIFGRNIKIYPVRGSNNGDTFRISDLANAIIWAADQNVDIINLSLGMPSESATLKNAISYAIAKNIVFVVAAGNDGYQLTASRAQYPAMYNTQFGGLISVSSVNAANGSLSSFSNYSSTYVDILAPGSDGANGIYSTVPTSTHSSRFSSQTRYSDGTQGPIQGTSMAAPQVTGAIAAAIWMAKSKGVTYSNTQLKTFLKDSAAKSSVYSSYASSGNLLNLPSLFSYMRTKLMIANTPSVATANFEINLQPTNKQVVAGEKIELNVNAVGNQTATYQWYQNNNRINGATTKTLTLSNVSEGQSGIYFAEVRSGTQLLNSQRVYVKVAVRYCY